MVLGNPFDDFDNLLRFFIGSNDFFEYIESSTQKNETFKVNFKHCVGNVHEGFFLSEMAYFLFKRTPVTLEFSQRGLQIYIPRAVDLDQRRSFWCLMKLYCLEKT